MCDRVHLQAPKGQDGPAEVDGQCKYDNRHGKGEATNCAQTHVKLFVLYGSLRGGHGHIPALCKYMQE